LQSGWRQAYDVTMHFRAIMFFGLWAIAGTVIAQPAQPAQPAASGNLTDHGTLKILAGGQLVGTETFDIEPAGTGFRMRGELKVKMPNGKDASESAVINLTQDLIVTSYTRVQKSPTKASVQMDMVDGHAKAHYITPEGPRDYEFMLEPAAIILDTNFFHQYVLLILRYNTKKGGAQHVQVLIPQEATPGMVLLEYLGKDDGHDKWSAKTDALSMEIWTDGARLFKLAAPAAKVEVIRDTK
jgi:hypothetical protein